MRNQFLIQISCKLPHRIVKGHSTSVLGTSRHQRTTMLTATHGNSEFELLCACCRSKQRRIPYLTGEHACWQGDFHCLFVKKILALQIAAAGKTVTHAPLANIVWHRYFWTIMHSHSPDMLLFSELFSFPTSHAVDTRYQRIPALFSWCARSSSDLSWWPGLIPQLAWLHGAQ